jgi:hypothetical protein
VNDAVYRTSSNTAFKNLFRTRYTFSFKDKTYHLRPIIKMLICSLLISQVFSSCQKEAIAVKSDYQRLGSAAHDLLSATPYDLLEIEISYMPGYAPGDSSVNHLLNFLKTHLNKPAGINIFQRQIPASGKAALSLAEIVATEKKYRTNFTAGRVIGVHILLTDGDYAGPDIFASSYWNTSFCLFGKTVFESSGGSGQVSRAHLITALLEHEFGHLLGLINQGSAMQQDHLDAGNGAHCDNPDCLMFHEITNTTSGGTPIPLPTLDDPCIADLKANGGK